MEEKDCTDMFARQWWVWYLGDIQQQSDCSANKSRSPHSIRTPISHWIVTQSWFLRFIAFWLLAWFFFLECSSASSPLAETGTSVRAPLPPLHLALYFSDRVRSTEVTVCISSISVRQQYNRAEERHVNWESKGSKKWKKNVKRRKRKG